MSYEREIAGYMALRRITETHSVKHLLSRARVYSPERVAAGVTPRPAPPVPAELPDHIVAIDGSRTEVGVRNGYPGAAVGYLTVASVLFKLHEIDRLDARRPVDPRELRNTEEAWSIDAALPGSNVVTDSHSHARDSFREALFHVLRDHRIDSVYLLDTYEALLAYKPQLPDSQRCPYDYRGCIARFAITAGVKGCPCPQQRPVFPTDALRIHERFRETGTNGEAFGEVMQVWERVLLVHLLRAFERQDRLAQTRRLAFFLDGPLAVFGNPHWLSAAISKELKRLNAKARIETGNDLTILGIERTGAFVEHFEQIDQMESPGEQRFTPGTYMLPTDAYIKERIVFSDSSDSSKRYGADEYFGRKVFYKSRRGARIIASLPFLSDAQNTLESDDIDLYPRFATACALIDKLASSWFSNALTPLVSAHAQAVIPLHLGDKVLEQLSRELMRDK
jgi:hypothetical protein